MTREEFYKLTDILNSEVLGNFMHGGEADEVIAMFEESVEHSNILEQEEPVSEDLEYASEKYACKFSSSKYGHDKVKDAFIAGADWQKEQFEKERLKHCDALTAEQAQIESDFVTQHLKENSRIPTFIDAIEYGMQLMKEQFEKDCADLCNGIASAKGLAVTMAYDKGMDDAREKMMANAIAREVKVDAGGYPYIPQMELYDYDKDVPLAKEGDKYKVILIKEG